MDNKLTHIDAGGNPSMVDVSDKADSKREAIAQSVVIFPEEVAAKLEEDKLVTKKGSIEQTAIIAGVMGAKKTAELIPFCHQLNLSNCKIQMIMNANRLSITCTATTIGKTGVEMEALTGASVAALTVYDMCKALSHHIEIGEIKLLSKTGGKSDISR